LARSSELLFGLIDYLLIRLSEAALDSFSPMTTHGES